MCKLFYVFFGKRGLTPLLITNNSIKNFNMVVRHNNLSSVAAFLTNPFNLTIEFDTPWFKEVNDKILQPFDVVVKLFTAIPHEFSAIVIEYPL